MKIRFTTILICLLLWLPLCAFAEAPIIQPRIVEELPHEQISSTQGLFFKDGMLYESSGGYEESFLAIVQPDTGLQIAVQPIPGLYFAEGIAPVGKTIRLLTWQSGVGFIHDIDTLEPISRFTHNKETKTEGWGLTTDGTQLYRSSGNQWITLHQPDNFALVSSFEVTDEGKPVLMLNELEFINGLLFANIWKSDKIAVIDPANGHVVVWIDITSLREGIPPNCGTANGIAYDEATGRIFVTGKHWDKVFVIEVEGIPFPPQED